MFRFSQRSRGGKIYPTVLGLFGFEFNSHDNVADSPTARKVVEKVRLEAPPNGWEGIKQMFAIQEPNGVSVELQSCVQLGLCSFVTGFIIGGIDSTKFTVRDFKERNQATIYKNTFEAQRSVQDAVTKDFCKGGFKMGLKCSTFLFIYSLTTSTLSVYRGKTSISDFAVGGAMTGALFTLNRGLAGAMSGGTVGLVLGTITGTIMVGALYACGINLKEVRMWQYHQYQKRVGGPYLWDYLNIPMVTWDVYLSSVITVGITNKAFLKDTEKSSELHYQVANSIMTAEEKDHGRIIDELENVTKNPVDTDVVVPLIPPSSMFRK